jgi:hypothetical protein
MSLSDRRPGGMALRDIQTNAANARGSHAQHVEDTRGKITRYPVHIRALPLCPAKQRNDSIWALSCDSSSWKVTCPK